MFGSKQFCLEKALLLGLCVLLAGCGARNKNAAPSIEFTRIPLTGEGGPDKLDTIEGRVTGARPGQQIVLFAKWGPWWVQPFVAQPFTRIQPDSKWRNSTHFGTDYAALLVEPEYRPQATMDVLPSAGGGVVALAITKGRPVFWQTWWFVLSCALGLAFTLTGAYLYNSRRLENREQQLAVMEDALRRRLRAEEGLRASEERYRSLYEDTPSMYFTVDPAGVVLSVNEFGAQQLGYTAKELVGESVLRVFYDADKPQALAHVEECLAHPGRVFQWELRKVRKDGSLLWVKEVARTVRSPEGKQVVLIVCEDITEVRRLEDQLRQAQKMDAIGRLAGGVAHDFNNLLNVILASTEMQLYELSGDSPVRIHSEHIRKASDQAAGLTRQLLAFSRQESAVPKVLDLNDVLREIGGLLPRLIGEDIEVAVRTSSGPALVRADSIQLQQIILNLAGNARDAMPKGGKIGFETTLVELDEEFARQHPPCTAGPHVLMSVSDTGSAIPKEVLAHIFEPFFTTKEQGQGTGLGLFMVYGIVQQAGGTISIYSEPGLGTTFKIYLPHIREAVKAAPAPEVPLESLRGAETILLVEDQETLRRVMSTFLRKQGYTVLEAGRPSEAIEAATQHKQEINLLVTDVVMPGMNGPSLARHIWELYPEIKTLFVSGYTPDRISLDELPEAEFAFLEKPVRMKVLAQKLHDLLYPSGNPTL